MDSIVHRSRALHSACPRGQTRLHCSVITVRAHRWLPSRSALYALQCHPPSRCSRWSLAHCFICLIFNVISHSRSRSLACACINHCIYTAIRGVRPFVGAVLPDCRARTSAHPAHARVPNVTVCVSVCVWSGAQSPVRWFICILSVLMVVVVAVDDGTARARTFCCDYSMCTYFVSGCDICVECVEPRGCNHTYDLSVCVQYYSNGPSPEQRCLCVPSLYIQNVYFIYLFLHREYYTNLRKKNAS